MINSKNNEMYLESQRQEPEKFNNKEFEKWRMKLKKVLYRNSMNNYNKNIKSYSYSNFPEGI